MSFKLTGTGGIDLIFVLQKQMEKIRKVQYIESYWNKLTYIIVWNQHNMIRSKVEKTATLNLIGLLVKNSSLQLKNKLLLQCCKSSSLKGLAQLVSNPAPYSCQFWVMLATSSRDKIENALQQRVESITWE